MNANQAKHFLLSIDEDKFIDWYNNSVVEPYGEYYYSTIRNNSEDLFKWIAEIFDTEAIFKLCKDAKYCTEDKYVIVTSSTIVSFNTIEDFLNIEYHGNGIVDCFLDCEEDYKRELLGLE